MDVALCRPSGASWGALLCSPPVLCVRVGLSCSLLVPPVLGVLFGLSCSLPVLWGALLWLPLVLCVRVVLVVLVTCAVREWLWCSPFSSMFWRCIFVFCWRVNAGLGTCSAAFYL